MGQLGAERLPESVVDGTIQTRGMRFRYLKRLLITKIE